VAKSSRLTFDDVRTGSVGELPLTLLLTGDSVSGVVWLRLIGDACRPGEIAAKFGLPVRECGFSPAFEALPAAVEVAVVVDVSAVGLGIGFGSLAPFSA
jgi:hypothetical protein